MAEEKWFEFVARMNKEQGFGDLKQAMKYASENKSKWQKGGNPTPDASNMVKKGGKKGKGKTRKNKTGSRRKM